MKRTLASLLSLVALTGLTMLASCNKEDAGDGTQFRATMEGCSARDGKTTLGGDWNNQLNWVEGDQVAIYGTAGRGLYAATPQTPATTAVFDNVSGTTGDGPFRAFYPASLTTDGVNITLPATQTYEVNSTHEFPMYAESSTNQLAFKNLCGVLKLHLIEANTNITSISVTANTEICGNYTVSYVNDVPQLSYTAGGSNTVTMTFPTALSIGDTGRVFYFALPAFDSLKSITITTDDGRYCTKTVKSNVCINVQRSVITPIIFYDNDMDFVELLPEGALPGLFTINADGDQVRFSQGNLQYQASTDTWRFAENQWGYVGNATLGTVYENGVKCNNALISATYSGWIDLFGWGTSGWNSGAVCYQPWSNSQSFGNYNPGGSSSTNLTGAYAEADWGWHNAISNGGNSAHQWRTLSRGEWDYLLNTRANASVKKATGSVNEVHGLILLPDSWTLPEGCSFNAGFASDWTHNTYTLAQWIMMEAAGALFLPAAGGRGGKLVNSVGYEGEYWSSSHFYYTANFASGVSFSSSNAVMHGLHRYYARSVRLVRDNN